MVKTKKTTVVRGVAGPANIRLGPVAMVFTLTSLALGGLAPFSPGAAPEAAGQNLPAKSYIKKDVFFLPILIDEQARAELREVQLYAKDNPAQPWVLQEKVPPTQASFTFRAPKDGEYWFAVVTVDRLGRSSPADLGREGAGQIVVLDTQPPLVDIQALPPTQEGQPLTCSVRDVHLDPTKVKVFYQTADQVWRPLDPMPGRPDLYCIPVQAVFTGLVRATAADLAGNITTREINLRALPTPAPGIAATPPTPSMPPPVIEVPAPPPPLVSSEKPKPPVQVPVVVGTEPPEAPGLSLTERVQIVTNRQPLPPSVLTPPAEKGPEIRPATPPSPVSSVPGANQAKPAPPLPLQPSLTPPAAQVAQPSVSVPSPLQVPNAVVPVAPRQDSAILNKQVVNSTRLSLEYQVEQAGSSGVGKIEIWLTRDRGQTWQRHCEDQDRKSPIEVELPGEGLFGLSLVASNGRGFGGNPPAPGDPADWWVEVDVSKPVAELLSVRPCNDQDPSVLLICWTARDRNLGPYPVDLFFAANREGQWHPIAKGLKNEGQYRWTVPTEVGAKAFIRLVVHDQAGNSTTSETLQPVLLDDLSRPRVRVTGITTVGSKISPPPPGN